MLQYKSFYWCGDILSITDNDIFDILLEKFNINADTFETIEYNEVYEQYKPSYVWLYNWNKFPYTQYKSRTFEYIGYMTYKEIAIELKISVERVRQLEAKAIKKLRKMFKDKKLITKEYLD